jgi:hypothetical protein
MKLFNQFRKYHLMDKAGEGEGGGGGARLQAAKAKAKVRDKVTKSLSQKNSTTDSWLASTSLKAKAKKAEGEGEGDDDDLITKAKKAKEQQGKDQNNSKALESALRFSMGSDQWLKDNKSLLPSEVEDIFTQANKETYDSPIEKDAALKSGIVQSFFSVQDNLDLLTPGLKNQVEDYLKLTKNGKQEKAQHVYESIFEPTFEMLKRLKKAESLQKGHNPGDNIQDGYKQRLMKLSQKHYIGESKDA